MSRLHLGDYNENARLPKPGGELLWSMRTWVIRTCRQFPVEPRIREVLGEAGVPEAADLLFGFMWVIGRATLRPLTIARACEPGVGEDERLLLDVIALYQHRRPFEAMVLLRSFLPPQAALAARDSAASLAAVLLRAGCWFAAPCLPAVQHTAFASDAEASVPMAVH